MSNVNKQFNRLSGRYEIIEQIGVGGMSYVYKAFDSKKKRIVAIKVLKDELSHDEEIVNKFKSEAIASKEIRHKNVVSAYDVVDDNNMHYIVMEYIEGITLNKYIKENGKLSNEDTIKVSLQVAQGILAAHKKGIIHRDIKPQNIVVDKNMVAKITDFGIARAITSTTRNITVVGTVHYISPEQVRNTVVDFRSDIYSFGCTIYEMITGITPFSGETPIEIIMAHLRENIKKPSVDNKDIFRSLEKIIMKATRMVPKERYQSIDDMIYDLELAINHPDGEYIKDYNEEEDIEGKTVIIGDEDMKVIKAVSERFSNRSSYKRDSKELTPEQKEFFERYIKNGAYRQHVIMRRVMIGIALAIIALFVAIIIIWFDTRKTTIQTEIIEITSTNYKDLFEGVDINMAMNYAKDNGIILNVVDNEYNDKYGFGTIIRVVKDDINENKTLDVVLSKGSEVLDFTNTQVLNNTKWETMKAMLDERKINYSTSEINDINVTRGYIIGVNKKKSDEPGDLVFTISRGISDNIKTMPNLHNKNFSEVLEILQANELILGDISYIRDLYIRENYVIKQSIEKGAEVKSGTKINLVLSCGKNGEEHIAIPEEKWHGKLTAIYEVPKGDSDETIIIQIRLRQITNMGIEYHELIEPQEYKFGTKIPLLFTDIEGTANIQTGQVEVVDVVNDKVLGTFDITFWPKEK